MLMGVVANMAPELFLGIIADVPFVDVLNKIGENTGLKIEWTEEVGWGAQIEGLNADRYDIEAKIDEEQFAQIKTMSSEDRRRQIGLMLQALLADRFHLGVNFQSKELPVYALVLAKGALSSTHPLLRRQAIRALVAARTPKKLRRPRTKIRHSTG